LSPTEFSVGTKVISGLGSLARLSGEVEQSGARRLAVVADRGVADAGLLAEVLQRVHENYVNPVDDHALMHSAVRGLVEIIGLCGYYTMVSMTLNTFEFDLPGGEASELA